MADLVQQLGLDDAVAQPLITREGPFGALIDLVSACESDDEAAFSAAFGAHNFTLRQVNLAHMEALVWADSVTA
jgi:EAL and modified HD-GYP domain-containing signal transduction protein